jgi:hypothetical protein
MAITAVVLGGASIFGGRGTVSGRCSAVQHRAAAERAAAQRQPAELSGILTGVLLVATIMVDLLSRQAKARPTSPNHRNGARRSAQLTGSHPERGHPRGRADRRGEQLDAGRLAATDCAAPHAGGRASHADGRGADAAAKPSSPHAQGKGDPYFISAERAPTPPRRPSTINCSGTVRPISTRQAERGRRKRGSRAA